MLPVPGGRRKHPRSDCEQKQRNPLGRLLVPFPTAGPQLVGVPGGYSPWPQSITAPVSASSHPPASPGQAAAAPFPTLAPPELLLSLWKHLALGRTARTDASWPYFLMKERARRKGALPPRPPHTHTRWNTCPFCTLAQVGSIWSQLGRCWWGSPARCSLGCR